jgi:predicted enzyme related to lactoylglutathione lyase
MGKVVHFEIPADDRQRASEFYRSIFGWEIQSMDEMGMPYTLVRSVSVGDDQIPTEPGAINGGIMDREAELPAPVITVDVESIDAALQRIEQAGGSVVRPRAEIPGMGAFAYFKDPEGNVMGLWENLPS